MDASKANGKAFLLYRKTLQRVELNLPLFRIGRDSTLADCCINNPAISHVHAHILKKNDRYYIVDCSSSSHTYLNKQIILPCQEYLLHYGDHIRFANEEYIFIDPLCAKAVCKPSVSDELYSALYNGLQAMQKHISCPEASFEEVNCALHEILLNNPGLCHFEGDWKWNDGVEPCYTLTLEHSQNLEIIANIIANQLQIDPKATAFEKAACIYQWLASSVIYDSATSHGQTAFGALIEHRAVCKGIAKAYQLLLKRFGIPCELVEGSLDGVTKHVWVRFCVDDVWYHSDVTMFYPRFNYIWSGITDNFIAISEDQISKTHIFWNGDKAPIQEEVFFQSIRDKCKRNLATKIQIPVSLQRYLNGEGEFLFSGSVGQIYRFGSVVLKRIPCGETPDKLYYAMRECALLQRLADCDQVVKLNTWDVVREHDGYVVYLVLEYRQSLDEYCTHVNVTPSLAVSLILNACDALIKCYQLGVAHLDIQPGNFLVSDQSKIILTDFSSSVTTDELAGLSDVRGTPAYMAPEIYFHKNYSQAADVYSLGIVLYCLLNDGNLPFGDESSVNEAVQKRFEGRKVELTNDVSEILRFCVEKACSFDPSQRYPDLKSFMEALKQIQASGDFVSSSKSSAVSNHTPTQKTRYFDADSFGETTILSTPIEQSYVVETTSKQLNFKADSLGETTALSTPIEQSYAVETTSKQLNFKADSFGETTVLSVPQKQDNYAHVNISHVQFSAIAPKSVVKGEYALLYLYMYEEAFRYVVDEALVSDEFPMQERKSGFYQVNKNARIKVELSSKDIEIDNNVFEETWSGRYLCFDFCLDIPENFPKNQILLIAKIYIEGVLATQLLMTMRLQAQSNQQLTVQRKDIYSAFVSYASQDRSRVASVVQGMQKIRPDLELFFDVNSLRSGDDWEEKIFHELDKREVLFLFWSKNAKKSPWVNKEWRYILDKKGIESIEPIPIELPEHCPPPKELSNMHFNDSLLYIIEPNKNDF